MRTKVTKKAKTASGEVIGYAVKVDGKKFPKTPSSFYFPKDRKASTAVYMAIHDYLNYQLGGAVDVT